MVTQQELRRQTNISRLTAKPRAELETPAVITKSQEEIEWEKQQEELQNEWEKQQEELQKEKQKVGKEIEELRVQLDEYNKQVQANPNDESIQKKYGKSIIAVGNKIDELNIYSRILSNSYSVSEASQRKSLAERQQQAQESYKADVSRLKTLEKEGKVEIIRNKSGEITGYYDISAKTQPSVTSQAKYDATSKTYGVSSFGTKGTYDPKTQTYTSPEGYKQSMALSEALKSGAVIQIQPKISSVVLKQETQRYKDYGYTDTQAKVLAKESLKQGGMSFSPEYANKLLSQKGISEGKTYKLPYEKASIKSGGTYGTISTISTDRYIPKIETRETKRRIPIISDIVESKRIIDIKAKKFKELTSNLNKLSQEEFEKRIKELKNLGVEVTSKIEGENIVYSFYEPTIEVGAFKYTKKKVPISELSSQGLVRYSGELFTSEIGSMFKVIAKDIGIKGSVKTYPEYTATQNIWYGTGEYNPLTREAKPFTREVTIPSKTEYFGTPEQIGKGVKTFGQVVTFVPTYFGGLGEAIIFGSKYGGQKGVKEYVFAYPLETIAITTGGAISIGGKVISKAEATKVSQQLLRLSEKPVKYFEYIDKPKGEVLLKGFQESEKLRREILIKGKWGKTELGYEFVPEAKGYATTTGEVRGYLGRKRKLFMLNVFEAGAKGGSIPYKTFGDIEWYKTFGISTHIPRGSTYALYKKGTDLGTIKGQLKKNIVLRGDIYKDISFGDVLKLKKNIFLGVKKDRELGLTLVKEAKKVKEDLGFIKPAQITKTPFSKTFGEVSQAPVQLFDIKTIKTGIGKQVQEIPIKTKVSDVKPISVSITEEKPAQILITKEKAKVSDLAKVWEESGLGVGSGLKNIYKTKTKQEGKQISDILSANIFAEAQTQPQKERQAQQLRQIQKQKLSQLQKQVQQWKLSQLQKQIQKAKAKPIIKPLPLLFGGKMKQMQKEKPEVFEAFGKRFGKELKLGKFGTQKEAEVKLEKFLKKTLGASGFLKKDEKKIKAEEISLLKDVEFGKSKVSEYLVIEKKEKRLRKRGTGQDIQYFRKNPRKTKALFNI